eukprot:Platyproteum_vivax@DN17032_c0_g1_i1.p1
MNPSPTRPQRGPIGAKKPEWDAPWQPKMSPERRSTASHHLDMLFQKAVKENGTVDAPKRQNNRGNAGGGSSSSRPAASSNSHTRASSAGSLESLLKRVLKCHSKPILPVERSKPVSSDQQDLTPSGKTHNDQSKEESEKLDNCQSNGTQPHVPDSELMVKKEPDTSTIPPNQTSVKKPEGPSFVSLAAAAGEEAVNL